MPPSLAVLDLEPLLAPISAESPTGVNLRLDATPDSPYYRIRDARQAAGSEERANPGDRSAALPHWAAVQEVALEALRHQTKDLRFSCPLSEALLRTAGVPGLRDGFRLTRELVERFWDKLYPMPDDDGLATRVAPIAGLNGDGETPGTLIDPIHALPLTASLMLKNYTFANYTTAFAVETAPEETKKKKLAAGATTIEQIKQSVADTHASFYGTLRDDLKACLEEFRSLSQALGRRCGHDTPSASYVRNALQGCLEVVLNLGAEKLKECDAKPEPPPTKPGPPPNGEGEGETEQSGLPRTREDALRQVEMLARFFREQDPHTILAFALEKVARWGRMPLPQLLVELIPDESARLGLFVNVGITPPKT
jgi:type VI secretion system protein ImpA